MKYTTQQALAIQTRDVSIALAAGAGCGKTFVLTQRFVAELMRAPSTETLSGMLAITFTDRAAREMRDRIRETVREQLARCPDEELPQWQEILQELESARIQTIHSFCTTTLRSHATELGLDPDFAVLDDPTATTLRNEAIQTEFTQLLRRQDPDACEFVLRYGLEGTLSRLQSLVNQRFQLAEVSELSASPEALQTLWKAYHRERFLPERFKELAESTAATELFSLLKQHVPTAPRMQDRRNLLLIHLETLTRTQFLSRTELQELRENATVQYVTAKHWPEPEIHEQVKLHCESLREQIKSLEPMLECEVTSLEQAAHYGIQALRLTQSIVTAYDRAKQERSVLDFDDLLLQMRSLLTADAHTRKQMQRNTRFLLLDEFQDTDPVQTQIVKALCGEQLTTGSLFLVGDVKQSIYRFRRADPAVFRELRGQIPPKGQLSLTQNFRSQQEILDFVNFLFAPAMPGEYDALEAFDQGPYPPEDKVEFLFAAADKETKLTAEEKRTFEAEWIASRIRELLSDPTPRVRKWNRQTGEIELRTVQPGDIVILFRAFSNLGLYEDALRKAGIDYYVVAGRAFFAQQEIYDLVNLCRFLDDDSDEAALVGVLRSPLFGWDDDTLMLMNQHCGGLMLAIHDQRLPEQLSSQQATCVRAARKLLQQLLELRMQWGIGPLLRYAVTQTAYDAALLTEFLGERKVANLQKLLEMADDFDRIGLLGLSDFADRLLESVSEEAKEELAATHPETGNVVRLMTVHQSKGLEFPVVIVADINRKQNHNTESAVLSPVLGPLLTLPVIRGVEYDNPALKMYRYWENQEDRAEAIRLFYVATTRAADHLILSCQWEAEDKVEGPGLKLLQDRFDLQTGLPRGDALLGQTQNPGQSWQRIPRIRVITQKPTVVRSDSGSRKLRLSQWEETLATSEPTSPSPLAFPLEADRSARERFSVSELEEVEGLLKNSFQAATRSPFSIAPTATLKEAERLGHLLHTAMEQLDVKNLPDPHAYIEELCAASPDHISPALQATAIVRLEKVFQTDWLQEMQQAIHVYRETEFLLRWTSPEISFPATIAGTVDCLLQDQTGNWHLIDFKTGGLPDNPSQVLEKFGLQMSLYALAILELTGKLPASIRIVQLTETPRVVNIPLTEIELQKFRQTIDQSINWLRSNRVPER